MAAKAAAHSAGVGKRNSLVRNSHSRGIIGDKDFLTPTSYYADCTRYRRNGGESMKRKTALFMSAVLTLG